MPEREPSDRRLRELLWEAERLAARVRFLVEAIDNRRTGSAEAVWPPTGMLGSFFE